MPAKTTTATKRTSSRRRAARTATTTTTVATTIAPNARDDSDDAAARARDMAAVVGPLSAYALATARQRRELRRRYEAQFDELAEMLCADAVGRGGATVTHNTATAASSSSPRLPPGARLPTLQIGFLARAMGLNVSNDQVILLTELVEDDAPSRGTVRVDRLKRVLVHARLTGVLACADDDDDDDNTTGNNVTTATMTARAAAVGYTSQQLTQSVSRCCARDDAARIVRAFETLDTQRRGTLDAAQLRRALTTMGDRMTDTEVDEMMLALLDPDTGVANYRDFVDVLAHE